MISYGLERQKVYVLAFAASQNATSHRLHTERSPQPDVRAPQRTPRQTQFAPAR